MAAPLRDRSGLIMRLPNHPGIVLNLSPPHHYGARTTGGAGASPHLSSILGPPSDDKTSKEALQKLAKGKEKNTQELSEVDKKAGLALLRQSGWKALDNMECLLLHLHMFAKAPPHEAVELFQAILLILKRKEKRTHELGQIHPEELVLIAKACHARKIDCKEFLQMFSGVLIKAIAENRFNPNEIELISSLLVKNGIVATLSGQDLCLLAVAYQTRKDSSKELFQSIFKELQKDSWKKLAILTSKEIISLTAAFSEMNLLTPEFTEVLMCKCYNLTRVSGSSHYMSSLDTDRG